MYIRNVFFGHTIQDAHLRTMNISNKIQIIKFLFIRLSSMGDILLTTPVIRAIRNQFPNARIDYLVSKPFADVLAGNPYIDNLLIYDKSKSTAEILEWKKELISNSGKYDFAIDLQNNLRSKVFRSGIADKIYSIPKRRLHKLALVNFKHSPYRAIHVVDNYFKAVNDLNTYPDELGLDISASAEFDLRRFFSNADNQIIAIAPGAAHFTKRLPIDKYRAVIAKLNQSGDFNFALIGGHSDRELCDALAQSHGRIVNFAGELSINQTAKAIADSDLLITNDTGVMHIGAAVQTPLIAVFGSTTQELGFTPYKCSHRIIEVPLPCRPCTHIGLKECPRKHFNCMNTINVDEIAEQAMELLG